MMRSSLFAALAIGVTACGPSISTNQDPAVPIPAGSTYSWGAAGPRELPGERNPAVNNDIVHHRIHQAVDREMAAKGFRRVESSGDFLVHYHIGIQPKRDTVVDVNRPIGRGFARPFLRCGALGCWRDWRWSYWGPPEVSVRMEEYYEGALLIGLVQASTGRLAWRGVGRNRVDDPEISEQDLDETIRAIVDKVKVAK